MGTATYAGTTEHSNDATFRAWGSALSTQLQAMAKLAKTSDTGQINWSTATRPAGSTDAGYEIYYLNDALHATAPIYFKLYFGTGGVANAPRLRVEFGTGSNGAGVLTGTHSGSIYHCILTSAAGSATPTYITYVCAAEGFFSLMWMKGSADQGLLSFCRTCDTGGTPNAYGYGFIAYGANSNLTTRLSGAWVRFSETPGVVNSVPASTTFHHIYKVYGLTAAQSVLPSGDLQAWLAWGAFPDMRPMFGWCGVFGSQVLDETTFSTVLVGSTARTYLVNNHTTLTDPANSLNLAMLWE